MARKPATQLQLTKVNWRCMISRCYSPSTHSYPWYGARGIKVCARWKNSFDAFVDDMGLRPFQDATVERLDSNADYKPSNCKWLDRRLQQRNRRTVVLVEIDGETACVAEWGRRNGINPQTILKRLGAGWPKERAVREAPRRTKLVAEDVAEIRSMLLAGAKTLDVAKAFGVARATVSDIRIGRTWSALAPVEPTEDERCAPDCEVDE